MQTKAVGIERLVRQLESEYALSDGMPSEKNCHRHYLAWLTVLMLRELSALVNEAESDECVKKALSLRMDRLRALGII